MADAEPDGQLVVGAAKVEITPEPGIQLGGDIGRRRPVEEVRAPIYVRALVLEQGKLRVCILSLDLLCISNEWADRLRREVGACLGCPPDTVAVHCTQTHSAPTMGHCAFEDDLGLLTPEQQWLRGGDDRYNPFALQRILEAAQAARSAATPATLHRGAGFEVRVAFNRRYVLRDGTAQMGAWRNCEQVLYVEGPIDPEVGVLAFHGRENGNQPVAMLLSYTAHPVHGYPHHYVCPDWPGMWCAGVEHLHDAAGVPMVLNGCCGNVWTSNHLNPDHHTSADRCGDLLTATTQEILGALTAQPHAALACRSVRVPLRLRRLPAKVVQAARKLLKDHPQPMWKDAEQTAVEWEWVYAHGRLNLQRMIEQSRELEYEIQAVRLGDTALLFLGGEPFVEGQLQIKMRSPARRTYIAHMSNGYAGYIPTAEALRRGGYETHTALWSKYAPDSLQRIVDASVDLLKELF